MRSLFRSVTGLRIDRQQRLAGTLLDSKLMVIASKHSVEVALREKLLLLIEKYFTKVKMLTS